MEARLLASAWASVLAAMNSTPERPASIMRLTELQPPPPTPMTLMRAGIGILVQVDAQSAALRRLVGFACVGIAHGLVIEMNHVHLPLTSNNCPKITRIFSPRPSALEFGT
jgi:hypothetical protein